VANSISGINAGAECAHVTINGIGERAGNASLEEFVMALQCLYGRKHNVKTELLYETSIFVSNTMGIIVQPNKAIIGENAFGHESGIHTHGIINNPLTYEPISPELVGRKRWMQAGKHAGAHGIKAMLEEFGIKPTDEQLHNIVEKQKNLADKGKSITGSSEALAEVSIKVEDKKGNVVSARRAGEDVVVASVQAMMDAINKIMLKKMLYSKN